MLKTRKMNALICFTHLSLPIISIKQFLLSLTNLNDNILLQNIRKIILKSSQNSMLWFCIMIINKSMSGKKNILSSHPVQE
jgi:hypothetical protein